MTRRRMEEEIDRDIEEYLALETEENIARGMSPEEARAAARRKFGNLTRVKEETRAVWTWEAAVMLWADVRHALRRMRRAPGTAALVLFSLALAFAPSVTVFSVLDRLFLAPVPVKNPEQLVNLMFRDKRPNAAQPYQLISYPEFMEFKRSLTSFSGMTYQQQKFAVVVVNGRRATAFTHMVSADYFQVTGAPVQVSRQGVIVGHGFWKRELEARPDAVGRTLLIEGQPFPIAGIAPREFLGMQKFLAADLWIPLEMWLHSHPRYRARMERRDDHYGSVWARLRPGVSLAQAQAEVEAAAREMSRTWPATNRHLTGYAYSELADRERGGRNVTTIGVVLLGILLAVACANVTGILLARAEERRQETAIRLSLGASRGRLIREWMLESVILSVAGGALGLALARVLTLMVPALVPSLPIALHFEFPFGPRVWLYALAMMVVSALSFGLVPAWRGSRPNLLSGLRRDADISLLRVRVPLRSLLIVAQIAVAQVLLLGAGLVLGLLSTGRYQDPGFDPGRPVAMAMLGATGEDGVPRQVDGEAVRARLARIGGVRRVVYGNSVPLSGMLGPSWRMEAAGLEPLDIRGGAAGPAFLSTLGVRILMGRDLREGDEHAVLVNAVLARRLDKDGKAVGRQIRIDGNARQIVGVFQDRAWDSIYDAAQPRAIGLSPPRSGGEVTFALEVSGDPRAFVATLRSELAAAQPGAIVMTAKTLRQHYNDGLFFERTGMRFLYGMGLLALVLTVAGLHGVASALFARRSKEFAIRLALGAPPRRVIAMVLAAGVKLAVVGVAVGMAAGIPVGLLIGSKVPGISPWSLPALGISSAVVLAAGIAAAAQPATRVLRIQPAEIVRAE